MRLWVGGRQSGKTTKLVRWLVESDEHYLVTAYGVDYIRNLVVRVLSPDQQNPITADVVNEVMRRVYTVDDLRQGRRPTERVQRWAVDDVDQLLVSLVRAPVDIATHGADLQVESV